MLYCCTGNTTAAQYYSQPSYNADTACNTATPAAPCARLHDYIAATAAPCARLHNCIAAGNNLLPPSSRPPATFTALLLHSCPTDGLSSNNTLLSCANLSRRNNTGTPSRPL